MTFTAGPCLSRHTHAFVSAPALKIVAPQSATQYASATRPAASRFAHILPFIFFL
jgi:hypothetical protein